MNGDALLLERLLQLGRNRFVFGRDDARQQLDDRHLAAEAAEDRRELHADRAAAENDHRLRHLAQRDGFVARDDPLAIDLHARNASRHGSGGDDDFSRRREALLVAFDDVDLSAPGDRRSAFDPFDLVLLEQKLDALGQSRDHFVLARLHLIHVDADGAFADRDAPLLDVLHHLQRMRVLEQGLGGNASPDQAGAAERFLFLDDGGLQAQLRRANGRDVATGSRANHHNIELVRHVISRLRADCALRYGVGKPTGQLTRGTEGCQARETRYNTGCSLHESQAENDPHRRR